MTKLNLLPVSQIQTSEMDNAKSIQCSDPKRPQYLIILIPPGSECASVTRRICRLANETNSCIQLLGLYRDEGEELALRRELAMASALIRNAKVYVEIVIEKGSNWVEAVRSLYHTGDLIVCLTDLSTGIRRKPLSQILESNFKAPVYVFSKGPTEQDEPSLLSRAMAWSGMVIIVGLFFLLQVRIVQVATGGLQTLLLILVLIPEIWLVKAVNSLFF